MRLLATTPGNVVERKVVLVGDTWVGKRQLRTTLSHQIDSCDPGAQYNSPSVLDVRIDEKKSPFHHSNEQWSEPGWEKRSRIVLLRFWVLPSIDDGVQLRNTQAILYEAHLVGLCCNMTTPNSLDNVVHKWFPMIRAHLPHASIVLLGLRDADLENDEIPPGMVSVADLEKAGRRIDAICTLECVIKSKSAVELVRQVLAWHAYHADTGEKEGGGCIVA